MQAFDIHGAEAGIEPSSLSLYLYVYPHWAFPMV